MLLIEKGHQVDTVYTDFSKAFDILNHDIIKHKLAMFGIHSSLLDWIYSYLTKRQLNVKIANHISRPFFPSSGVPQGSHLGPLLFLIVIDDIVQVFKNVFCLLYADDLKIFMPIDSLSDCSLFQDDLNRLHNWCNVNQLYLNFSKCKVLSFHRKRQALSYNYHLNNEILARVESMVDLGVLFDHKLSFNDHVSLKISKAKSMLGFMKTISWDFTDVIALKSLYYAHVRSHVEYAACLWSPSYSTHSGRLESIQRNFSRYAVKKMNRFGDVDMPCYESRLLILNLEHLHTRRNVAGKMFIADILRGTIDAPDILSKVMLNVKLYNGALRNSELLYVPFHRTNYGRFEPVNKLCSDFNLSANLFDFNLSRNKYKCVLKHEK